MRYRASEENSKNLCVNVPHYLLLLISHLIIMKTETKSTLFERIGGMAAVDAAVDIFYTKVLADELVAPFFRWIDMRAQSGKQKAFLAYAFGAPMAYTGKSMRASHAHLVEKGLNDQHFDAVAKHLGDTLRELKVAEPLIEEVAKITESTRNDVLGKAQQ